MKIQAGQAAVITGAGGGIGQAVALALAQRQTSLALVDIDGATLEHTRQLLDPYAVEVSTHALDLADTTRLQTLPAEILAQHGRVDLLVNCAGVSLAAPLAACSADDLEWITSINLLGLMQTCRVFLPALSQPSGGHIVNLSSDFGFMGFPTKSAYCATKFGVRGFSEALRIELAGSGIGVTCVYPGAVDTGFVQKGRAWDAAKQSLEAQFVK
jgi:short-subunit dehydrogenase